MTIFLNSYKFSKGAFNVKAALVEQGVKVIMTNRAPRFKSPLIVSWGNSEFEYDPGPFQNIVNHPSVITYLSNKLRFFNGVGHSGLVPEWSTDHAEASNWEGKVFVRHKLEGSGGAGIEVVDRTENKGTPLPRAPLYVRHFAKTHEFRVHVGRSLRGEQFRVLLTQRKIFQKSADNPAPKSWDVRNHENGFVYVRDSGFPIPDIVKETAVKLMTDHFPDMHFAALDILYHNKRKNAVVLEGNTAPGLEGGTVQVYAAYLKQLEQEAYG